MDKKICSLCASDTVWGAHERHGYKVSMPVVNDSRLALRWILEPGIRYYANAALPSHKVSFQFFRPFSSLCFCFYIVKLDNLYSGVHGLWFMVYGSSIKIRILIMHGSCTNSFLFFFFLFFFLLYLVKILSSFMLMWKCLHKLQEWRIY